MAFLECDGLIVPSARWQCENLVIFTDNQLRAGRRRLLDVVSSAEFDWRPGARVWRLKCAIQPRSSSPDARGKVMNKVADSPLIASRLAQWAP